MATGQLGLKPSEFWSLTPAELARMAEGYRLKQEERCQEIVIEAWLTAMLVRQKRVPSLGRLLPKRTSDRQRGEVDPEKIRQEFAELLDEFRKLTGKDGETDG